MKSKMVILVLIIVIAASLSISIPQNAGQKRLYSSGTTCPTLSNISDPNPQIMGQPSSSSSGSGGLADSPWPMFRQNLNHTGVSPYDTSANLGKLKWSFMTGGTIESSPTIGTDGTIYVGSNDDKLYAINSNGTEKWHFITGNTVDSSPAIGSDGTIYVGSDDFKLYAINPNGTEKWSFMTNNALSSSPAIGFDGTIYIGSNDNKMYAINPDGTEKWNFTAGDQIHSSPAIDGNGTIYIGSHDDKLYAINPNGTKKWNYTTGATICSSPAIGFDGTIYAASNDGKLYAINPNGSKKWSYTIGYAFDRSSPAIDSDGTIYIGSYDNKLHAINPNGTEKWSFTTGGDIIASSPAIGSDGIIYFGSFDHKLYAINPDGTEKWSFITNHIIIVSSPAIGSDGTIYFGSFDHKLYAIGIPNIPPITNAGPDQTVNEGDIVQFDALSSYDPDGTIETYEWDFESDGIYDYIETTKNSQDGVFDGKTTHIYGDNGMYKVTLRVTDDDGLNDTDTCNITVNNVAPILDALPTVNINEFESVTLSGHAIDPGSDDLTFTWNWGYTLWGDKTTIYYNDGMGPDPFPSPAVNPRNITEDAICQFGDDGIFSVTLTVTDDDGGSTIVMTNVTVNNVAPIVTIESVTMDVEIGLRVTGRKYNNVSLTLYEDGNPIGNASIERLPGSPNEQMAWIPVSINFSRSYNATVTYTPKDPPNVGANPVWIYIKSKDGTIKKIHHTFNVQQSKKRDSEHWNHVEPWEVDLNDYFIGLPLEITSHIMDLGSDDETLTYTYGSQTLTVTYLNNPPNPDPYPSPEIKSMDITDTTTLIYEGPGTVTLIVKDDDNLRLGIGQGTDSVDVA
jgi:outer membrane protein assembly factor BamB